MADKKRVKLTRRDLFRYGGAATAAFTLMAMPGWVRRACAGLTDKSSKVLVLLFQRGAADGLNIIVPFRDNHYREARPSIGLPEPGKPNGVLDLNGTFGLHPALAPLLPLWRKGQMAAIHAVGSPDGTRSHFDAQDNMESGTPGVKSTGDGWLNRALEACGQSGPSPLTALAISPRLPRILRGDFPVTSFENLSNYKFSGGDEEASTFEQMYEKSVDLLLSGTGKETNESVKMLQKIIQQGGLDQKSAGYPQGGLGRSLYQLARVLKAEVGTRVAFIDVGGWDHHVQEGATDGRLQRNLQDLGGSIAAFYKDLGDKAGQVTLATMTEFGRTLKENGDRGTDHGHASVMMLFGGGVKGGKVYGHWPGLEEENLFEGRDLQVTTDFRAVQGEILQRQFLLQDLSGVFPGFTPKANLGFI